MRLVLLRHGIAAELSEMRASPGDPLPRDEHRPLTVRGIRRVRKAAAGLRTLGIRPDRIFHSGLVRARETAELVAARLRRAPALDVMPALVPDADPRECLRELAAAPPQVALCVGHLPHLDRLVALVCGVPGRAITAMGKAAACCVELPDSGRPAGRIVWFLTPRMLRSFGSR